MAPIFSYYCKNNGQLFFLIFIVLLPFFVPGVLTESTADQNNGTWQGLMRFANAQPGSEVPGLSKLKKYFQRFGYIPNNPTKNLTDLYDNELESAVLTYQKNMGLSLTGKLDNDTMNLVSIPRCGNGDQFPSETSTYSMPYTFFKGEPRWERPAPIVLAYYFWPGHMINSLSMIDIRSAFESAFSRWSAVVPVSFTETIIESSADIRIGFFSGDHGDDKPFDGAGGELAHAFEPENGNLHLDADELWTDVGKVKSGAAIDLESVLLHELGHILGLDHTPVKEAIMYPTIPFNTKKVNLAADDIEGIQKLYQNPFSRMRRYLKWMKSWGIGVIICVALIVFSVAFIIYHYRGKRLNYSRQTYL